MGRAPVPSVATDGTGALPTRPLPLTRSQSGVPRALPLAGIQGAAPLGGVWGGAPAFLGSLGRPAPGWRGLLRPVVQASDYTSGSLQRVDPATGKVELLYDSCNGHKLRGPNDIVFDAHGGCYFSDLGKTRARDRDHGGLYYALADGSKIVEVAYPILTPNGVGLSPDGGVVYVAETETARLWAFDITAPGVVRKQPFPSPHGGRLVAGLGGYQRFDSLAVDALGNICVATLITGALTSIAPDGRIVRQVKMPDPVTTNICFGGADLRTAYVTLSGTGKLVALTWPEAGLKLNHNG